MGLRLSDTLIMKPVLAVVFLCTYSCFSLPVDLESRLRTLEETVKKHGRENLYLREAVSLLQNDNHRLSKSLGELAGGQYEHSRVGNRRLLHQDIPIDGIGFYAYMSTDEPDPRGHHTLVYDVVQTNLGNGYNKNTGVFTAPRDGLYSFTWSTRVACRAPHSTDLIINQRILGSTYIYCGFNTVTGHVVATVSQGDVVFVRTHISNPGQGPITSNEYGRTTFSGFLIE